MVVVVVVVVVRGEVGDEAMSFMARTAQHPLGSSAKTPGACSAVRSWVCLADGLRNTIGQF